MRGENHKLISWFYEVATLLGLMLLAGSVFFCNLSTGTPLTQTDCWVAQTAREMQERGDWIVPSFCGQAWINKTPLPYWQLILTSQLLHHPIDAWLTRAFGALSAVGIVLGSYALARFAFGLRIAVFTALAQMASLFLLDYGRSGSSDIQVSFWCYASLACLFAAFNTPHSRGWMAGAYLAAGMGMLSKGPMPLVVVGLPATVYLVCLWLWPRWLGEPVEVPSTLGSRFLFLLKRLHLGWGVPLFLLVWLPWVVLLLPGLADRLHDGNWSAAWSDLLARWDTEFRQRASGELANIAEERYWPKWYFFGYYVPFVLFNLLPWTLSLPAALAWPFVKQNSSPARTRNLLFFAWVYFLAVFFFFSLSHGKEGRYITAALPPLGLLLGHHLAALFTPGWVRTRWLVRLSCWSAIVLIPMGCLAGWVLLGPPGFLTTLTGWFGLKLPNLTVQLGLDPSVQGHFAILSLILCLGFVSAAITYLRGHTQTSFGLMVATMLGGFLYYKPTLDFHLHSRDHVGVYLFAAALGKIVAPNESSAVKPAAELTASGSKSPFCLYATTQPVRLLASDNRDARVVWATNLKIPRLVDQFEFLRRQGGHRTIRGDLELGVREAMKELRRPEPTLVMTEISPLAYRVKDGRPNIKDGYLMRLLAEELSGMEAPYLWLQIPTSPPGVNPPMYKALVGNFPPPAELNLGPIRRVTLELLNVGNPTTLPTAQDFEDKLRLLEEQR